MRIATVLAVVMLGAMCSAQVAQGESAGPADVANGPQSTANETSSLQEIVVTAQKRSERLVDVPGSVSAVSGTQMQQLQISDLSDLANFVPGMSVSDGGAPGSRQISIRGLNTTGVNVTNGATVATYIDDVAVGCSTEGGRCALYGVDLNPFDVQQVEVLKGPQGTLYGADSLGGLIKYRLNEPNTERLEAQVGGDLTYVDGSNRPGGNARAALNAPLITDELALRVSGFYKNRAGWMDNPTLGSTDINHSTEEGGRATILWKPIDKLSVNLTGLWQEVNAANLTEELVNGATQQAVTPLQFPRHFPSPDKQTMSLYALSINWDVGFATVTSASSWSDMNTFQSQEALGVGAFCVPHLVGPAFPGCPDYPFANALAEFTLNLQLEKVTQEIRVASAAGGRIQWMVGGFYTKEHTWNTQHVPYFTPALMPLSDSLIDYEEVKTYKDIAGFATLTFNVTDRFALTGGGRYSVYSRIACIPLFGGFLGAGASPCNFLPSTSVKTWLGDATFHFTPDEMAYAKVATGYRPGAGCPTCGLPALGIPEEVSPDTTTNYEIGFKGEFLSHRLAVNLAAFYIDWKNIQLSLVTPPPVVIVYPGNGGSASSSGFELTSAYRLSERLQLNATLARTDAHLTQTVPGVGAEGSELPVSPLWTASLMAEGVKPLNGKFLLQYGGGYQYRDTVTTSLANQAGFTKLRPQNVFSLYAGLTNGHTSVRLYGNNVFNDRAFHGGSPANGQVILIPIQPATVGVSLEYKY